MSSKVLSADDPRPVAPLTLRQVVRGGTAPSGPTVTEVEANFAAQIAQLEQQHERRLREAQSAGVREGESAGRNKAAQELQPLLERLSRTIDELSQLRSVLRKEAEADMVKLSLAIARRVLRRELAIDPEALHGLVLAALEKLQGQEISRVKVHPAHAGAVRELLQKPAGGSTVEVLPDASRELGTVIFETQRGNLDASIDSQLQEIERGLADCLRRR